MTLHSQHSRIYLTPLALDHGKRNGAIEGKPYFYKMVAPLRSLPEPKFNKRVSPSRLLKNWAGRAISDLVCVIAECWAFWGWFFALPSAPVGVSALCRDTSARTYCARTAAAIRFRMRTRL